MDKDSLAKAIERVREDPIPETIGEIIVITRIALQNALQEAGYSQNIIELRLHAFTFYLLKELGYIKLSKSGETF